MIQIFKFKARAIITLMILGLAFQFAKAEFFMEIQSGNGFPFLSGDGHFVQRFIGYDFPQESPDPFDGSCDNYGKINGFNANPAYPPHPVAPKGPVDEIRITAITNASFPNSLNLANALTGFSVSKWSGAGTNPVWEQKSNNGTIAVMWQKNLEDDRKNFTKELYFNIEFQLSRDFRAFLYFDSYYKGIQKERYVIKWTGSSWTIYPVNICKDLPTPIAEWTFDECIENEGLLATTIFDDIAPPADGTLIGPTRSAGRKGNGLHFYHNQYADIGNPTKLNIFGKSMSVTGWAYADPTDLGSQDMFIYCKGHEMQGNVGVTQIELKALKIPDDPDYHFTFRSWNSGRNIPGSGVVSNAKLKPGVWYLVTGVYNEDYNTTPNSGMWKIYINGELDASRENPGIFPTSQAVSIGAAYDRGNPLQYWWHGFLDEIKVYDFALTDQQVLDIWNNESPALSGDNGAYCSHIQSDPSQENLVLWYDATDINDFGGTDFLEIPQPISNGEPLIEWKDKTTFKQNASISNNRIPTYSINASNGCPGISFYTDYASNHYGYSDILVGLDNQGDQNEFLTTKNTEEWTFDDQEDKNLIVLFKTGNRINAEGDPEPIKPYYSKDGRETIAEFGGPLSGFNIYINGGQLCFGMWNRIERRYTKLMAPGLYPLQRNMTYLAHIEYNKSVKGFKVHFSDGVNTYVSYLNNKEWIDFSGLTRESENENFAVGGASRTSYHDYNTGETYSDHFEGSILEVLLYNRDLNVGGVVTDAQLVYDFLSSKFVANYQYDYPGVNKSSKISQGEWVDLSWNETLTDGTQNVNVFPNPTENNSTLAVNFNADQNIRIELVDNLGNIVSSIYSGYIKSGLHTFNVDCSKLSTGFYTYRVSGDGFVQTGKLIISK